MRGVFLGVWLLVLTPLQGLAEKAQNPLPVADTQDPHDIPLTPLQARDRIEVPAGFRVSLFAGEPDVRQPIAFAIDDRGRLWGAECYSYRTWGEKGNDRIVILDDTDGDGRFDKRTVFWEQGRYLSGIQLGFGGVWICNAPYLQFIPDRDGNDQPDGPPQTLLDGWSTEGVHNVLNGLTWGPDGWLYGCNGILAKSKVGAPGVAEQDRVEINCGIWRFHPTLHEFEVVAHGTTNPWGLDFDQHGQAFFTNCVIHHLWHLIPGARYKRMFGQDFNPHSYQLMDSCADYLHWAGGAWQESRGGKGEHDKLGGGHAHVGAMIYLADNWPREYHNSLLTCNLHGNRVNRDLLRPRGSGYAAQRAPDFLFAHDPWFRGLELKYGPDGGVYISDWTDLGECHDSDGVHRSSGRIYKVVHESNLRPPQRADLAKLRDEELINLHGHANQWYVRHARRLLQERAVTRRLAADTQARLRARLSPETPVIAALEGLWTLHAIGGDERPWLRTLLGDPRPQVRQWAIRFLAEDKGQAAAEAKRFAQLAATEESASVRLELASVLQRLPVDQRWELAEELTRHGEDADDQNLPLMIWYGLEPCLHSDRSRALKLVAACKIPLIRRFAARRLVSDN